MGGGGAAGFWLQGELAEHLEQQAQQELESVARTVSAVLAEVDGEVTTEAADRVTDRLAQPAGVRLTVIAPDGTVLGDSEFDGLALAELESHGDRPEVVAARADGTGTSGRFSQSIETEMMYIAYSPAPDAPTVRAARRLSALRASMGRVRLLLAGAAGLLTVVAFLMSALASWFLSRDVNRLLGDAREIREDRTRRMDATRVGDFSELAGSINSLLDELEGTMEQLESQNQRMEAVLQGMNEPVLALDANQVITLSNRAVVENLGLSEAPLGRSLFDVLPAPELENLDFESGGDLSSVELELGSSRLLAQATQQRDQSGSVLVLHDITGIRRLEKMRRDFVANVSHELRTPVAVLQANAETLLDGALEEQNIAEKLVEAIHRQTGRLSNLVADLLDISRIEAGQYHLDREPVDVEDLCRQSLEGMERPAGTRRVTLRYTPSNDPGWVMADPKAVEQIVTNMLDNAIKYGRVEGTVTLRTRNDGNRVRFEVQDDGPGIDRKHHARLFERFYRVDKGRSRGMGGTGLGLSIVKHLVETMDGRVGYRAAFPNGSVFWFELPATTAPGMDAPLSASAAVDAL